MKWQKCLAAFFTVKSSNKQELIAFIATTAQQESECKERLDGVVITQMQSAKKKCRRLSSTHSTELDHTRLSMQVIRPKPTLKCFDFML
jgi:hypothetical protein